MRHILHFAFLLLVVTAYSQVGIGNEAPRGLLDVNDNPDGNATAGLVLPHVADVTTLQNPADNDATSTIVGTIAFNSTMDCIQFIKNDGTWSECISITQLAAVGSLDCSGATNNGTLTSETVAAGNDVNSVISYTGGNGGAYSEQTVGSEGVDGLMATLTAGDFATGDGLLTYTITGTPLTAGTATFAISIGGRTCNLTRTVNAPPPANLPGNIVLRGNQTHFIASANDTDYLPFTTPTTAATTDTDVAADGTAEATALDFQGTLTTTGVTIRIPYTVTTAAVTLPAFSQTIEVPANLTEDNTARMVEFSYPAQTNLAVGTSFIEATLKSTGGDLNAKKLDLQAGLGNDLLGILLASFTIAIDNSGGTGIVQLYDIVGIPDRRFGETTNQGGEDGNYHDNIYLPTLAEDGEVWLNHNLGAQYTRISHESFNPGARPTSIQDHNAYGNLFQWGRYSDGHELINYTGFNTYNIVNPTIQSTLATSYTPDSNRFITLRTSFGVWNTLTSTDDPTWQGVNGLNNPCPVGFRLPTFEEVQNLLQSIPFSGTDVATENEDLASCSLGFTYANARGVSSDPPLHNPYFGPNGFCFLATSGQQPTVARSSDDVYISASSYTPPYTTIHLGNVKSLGYTVRCIKD